MAILQRYQNPTARRKIDCMKADATLSAQSGTPPFLRLPFDIRLLIYRHLIPAINSDFEWTAAWDPNNPRQLSEERKLYSPPILHTNQVLHELHTFWPYRASVNNYGIRFMGYTFLQPPAAFRFIHTMDLMIHIDSYSHQKIADILRSFLEVTCVKGQLRRLQIGLTFSLLCFQIHMGNLRDLRKALEKNLNPLRRRLRGLNEVKIRRLKENSLTLSGQNATDVFFRQRRDFLQTVQSFMDQLVKESMMIQRISCQDIRTPAICMSSVPELA
ncbi:D-2-hydroxyacid dehydrogenase protein [Rutstroemia sp. NJR-2017a WRK4]|nr:D-2-hydroxyacid dehydrogenase protein [Rutstroemia sp. NJR-2017a WRK4]